MVEGFLNHMGCDVKSGGVESHGINPYAVKVMQEFDIDISRNKSKEVNMFNLGEFDILITVCDHAKETCLNVTSIKKKIHKSFIDPTKFIGSENEKLQLFRKVRDEINIFCNQIFNEYYG